MSDQPTTITLTEHEYKEIVQKLEDVAKHEAQQDKYESIVLSKLFWDNFFAKIFAAAASVKNWTLFLILYMPYELLKLKLISGENYASIIIVVAPVVIGLREFSKKIVDTRSNSNSSQSFDDSESFSTESSTSKMLKTVRNKFNI